MGAREITRICALVASVGMLAGCEERREFPRDWTGDGHQDKLVIVNHLGEEKWRLQRGDGSGSYLPDCVGVGPGKRVLYFSCPDGERYFYSDGAYRKAEQPDLGQLR